MLDCNLLFLSPPFSSSATTFFLAPDARHVSAFQLATRATDNTMMYRISWLPETASQRLSEKPSAT